MTEQLTRPLDAHKVAFITCVNDAHWYDECRLYLEALHLPADHRLRQRPFLRGDADERGRR